MFFVYNSYFNFCVRRVIVYLHLVLCFSIVNDIGKTF